MHGLRDFLNQNGALSVMVLAGPHTGFTGRCDDLIDKLTPEQEKWEVPGYHGRLHAGQISLMAPTEVQACEDGLPKMDLAISLLGIPKDPTISVLLGILAEQEDRDPTFG